MGSDTGSVRGLIPGVSYYEMEEQSVTCPYCGESFITVVDCSAGSQCYIEDCQVCCRPIEFSIHVDEDGELVGLETRREDD